MRRREFVATLSLLTDCLANPPHALPDESSQKPSVGPDNPTAGFTGKPGYWKFDQWGDRQGWMVSPDLTGAVTGGALWLTFKLPADAAELEQTKTPNIWKEAPP